MFGWLRAHRRAAYFERCWREAEEEIRNLKQALRTKNLTERHLLQENARLRGHKP